jgi:DNA-binding response OmpR family regulator
MPEVLVVDDDPDVRAMLSFTLVRHGFVVREATHGGTALEELERSQPDAMVLDLMMPVLDGYAVLEAMRDRGIATHTRVVILTCKVDERDLVRGWELGADEYLTKPVDPDHLAAKLHEVVGAGTHPRPEG